MKAYTTRAKELESAIYTQKRLMSSQETTVTAACIVFPAVAPLAKQFATTFVTLSSLAKVSALAYTFYTLANGLARAA